MAGGGEAVSNLESEVRITFHSDVDVAFALSGVVNCDLAASGLGNASCFAYVRLLDGAGQTLFDLTVASGILQETLTGTLRANESYVVLAWSEAHASVDPENGTAASSGGWLFTLTTDTGLSGGGGSVPEPSALALLALGAGGLFAGGRRRR